jgi:hypothetical protein
MNYKLLLILLVLFSSSLYSQNSNQPNEELKEIFSGLEQTNTLKGTIPVFNCLKKAEKQSNLITYQVEIIDLDKPINTDITVDAYDLHIESINQNQSIIISSKIAIQKSKGYPRVLYALGVEAVDCQGEIISIYDLPQYIRNQCYQSSNRIYNK